MIEIIMRGAESSLGQPGYCGLCRLVMPDGPDACLGLLPGVSHACCGHDCAEPYVVIGGEPDEPIFDRKVIELRGDLALAFFREFGKGPPE